MKTDIEILRAAKPILINHNKGSAYNHDMTQFCLGAAICRAEAESDDGCAHWSTRTNYLLQLIYLVNKGYIDERLARPHLGPPDFLWRPSPAVRFNNHSATTDDELQTILDNTISFLEELERYSAPPTTQQTELAHA